MRCTLFVALALSCAPCLADEAPVGPSSTVSVFAKSALTGMQLSVRKGQQQGKVPTEVGTCVQSLRDTSFNIVLASLLAESLSPSEMRAADAFFGTPVGRKYAKYSLLQIYEAVGEQAPEPLPAFTDAEYKELEAFSRTRAGDKLIVRRVLESKAAQQAIGSQIQALLSSCGAKL